jgi:hypothetical protein
MLDLGKFRVVPDKMNLDILVTDAGVPVSAVFTADSNGRQRDATAVPRQDDVRVQQVRRQAQDQRPEAVTDPTRSGWVSARVGLLATAVVARAPGRGHRATFIAFSGIFFRYSGQSRRPRPSSAAARAAVPHSCSCSVRTGRSDRARDATVVWPWQPGSASPLT